LAARARPASSTLPRTILPVTAAALLLATGSQLVGRWALGWRVPRRGIVLLATVAVWSCARIRVVGPGREQARHPRMSRPS
jgi:hypothetical protein